MDENSQNKTGDNKGIKYVLFTSEGTGFPIAYRLKQEGFDVYVGQAETFDELGIESTEEEQKKLTDSQDLFRGILKKYSAKKLVRALSKVTDKENYFIICDLNSLYVYGEELLKLGFTNGIFPTKEDYEFEKGREQAMKFVELHYPDINIIPYEKVETVEEARNIIESTDVPLVMQSEGDFVSTICPPDDMELNHRQLLDALDKYASEYSKGQIILKEKLVQPVEITPQIVFYNGEPVFTDIDIETKNIGDGENNGNQVGCGTNLIIKTNLEDKINKIAFPPVVYEMAKEHKGIFVWDISIYVTEKGMYFGEFCSNRFGYDAVLSEMDMSGGANAFFSALKTIKNPLQRTFGTSVRVFNLNKQKDAVIETDDNKNTWIYECKDEDGKMVSLGVYWDLAAVTGSADTIEEAVEIPYKALEKLSFKEKYTRTKDDFMDNYPTSIMNRFKAVNGLLFDVPSLKEEKKDEELELKNIVSDIKRIEKRFEDGIESLQSNSFNLKSIKQKLAGKIKSILNENRRT